MFPKVSYQTLCLSRAQGGVSLLDPITQQNALQLQWIVPMFEEPDVLPENILCLIHHMAITSKFATDHRLLLLDPNTRKQQVLTTASPVSLIYCTIDHLSITYPFTLPITIAMALQLPTTSIFDVNPDDRPTARHGYHKLQVKDLYIFDQGLQHLRPLQSADQPPHPILLKRFLKDVTEFRIFIHPFFAPLLLLKTHPDGGHQGEIRHIDYTPFAELLLDHDALSSCKPKRYQTHIQLQLKSPNLPSSIRWTNFWSINMDHIVRNILFRIVHSTIPTGNLLHRISPSYSPSPHCCICQHPTETLNHFLIWCPKKKHVWAIVWQSLFHSHPPLFAILQSVTKNARVQQPITSDKFLLLCSYILRSIWRAHWATIFEETPFVPQQVATEALNAITTHIKL